MIFQPQDTVVKAGSFTFANGNYERAGWSKLQIDSLW